MAIDELTIELFDCYAGPEFLPDDYEQLDQLIRYSVDHLSDETKQAKKILQDVTPDKSAKYLVPALADPNRRHATKELLQYYGPSTDTVKPLVGALADPYRRGVIEEILIGYGRACLEYIKQPRRDSPLYPLIIQLIESIRTQPK